MDDYSSIEMDDYSVAETPIREYIFTVCTVCTVKYSTVEIETATTTALFKKCSLIGVSAVL